MHLQQQDFRTRTAFFLYVNQAAPPKYKPTTQSELSNGYGSRKTNAAVSMERQDCIFLVLDVENPDTDDNQLRQLQSN